MYSPNTPMCASYHPPPQKAIRFLPSPSNSHMRAPPEYSIVKRHPQKSLGILQHFSLKVPWCFATLTHKCPLEFCKFALTINKKENTTLSTPIPLVKSSISHSTPFLVSKKSSIADPALFLPKARVTIPSTTGLLKIANHKPPYSPSPIENSKFSIFS